MATLENKVDPLDYRVAIVDSNGAPTNEFQRKWNAQRGVNGTIPDLTTAKAVSAVFDLLSKTWGSLLVRGQYQWTSLPPSADGKVLRDKGPGAAPIWDTISDILDTIANTRGTVLYRGAAGWAALPPSGTGKVLTDGGTGSDPSWQTPSSGGGAASAQDNGTTFYLALSDADGQLVLDGSGNPVFVAEVLPASALPAAGGYASGTLDNLTVNKVKGITNGSTAAAGDVGEELKTVLPYASGVRPVSSVAINITSLTLTPGDWRVDASGAYFPSTYSMTSMTIALSTTSNTLPSATADAEGSVELSTPFTSNAGQILNMSKRFNVTVNTTVYLVISANYTGATAGTDAAWGTIRAERVR